MKRVIVLSLALACSGESSPNHAARGTETGSLGAAPPPSSLITADTATVQVPLVLPSQLYVEHDATIYARSPGIVGEILVDLGSKVAAGQTLARLESTDQRIALEQAEEKLVNATQTVERQRALKAAEAGTQAESERAEFEYREASLRVRQAQRDLELTRITAPFAGVVTARKTRLHRLVSAGDTLFRLTALSPVLAAVHVPEAAATGLGIGAEAEVVGQAGATARGRIIRASPTIDPASGAREMIVQLTGGARLTPGSSVSVRLGAEPRQVVAVPRSAVDKDGYALVWADERATLRPLTLGSELAGDRVEVVRGLAPGERLVRTAP
ncbi:MAG: hypothetical protein K0S19_177 [Geminicoccaceae bacterium]|nr:hypothetical protein [Geminicoccaceae bacterium]